MFFSPLFIPFPSCVPSLCLYYSVAFHLLICGLFSLYHLYLFIISTLPLPPFLPPSSLSLSLLPSLSVSPCLPPSPFLPPSFPPLLPVLPSSSPHRCQGRSPAHPQRTRYECVEAGAAGRQLGILPYSWPRILRCPCHCRLVLVDDPLKNPIKTVT